MTKRKPTHRRFTSDVAPRILVTCRFNDQAQTVRWVGSECLCNGCNAVITKEVRS